MLHMPSSFFESSITLMTKSDKEVTRKLYIPKPLKNIDAKVCNKILTNQVLQHIKRIMHQDQLRFIPGMHGWFKI